MDHAPVVHRLTGLLSADVSIDDYKKHLEDKIEHALNLPYRDFEDAIQMMAALQILADYLLTRKVRDYQPAPMEVIQPVELLAILKT